MIKRILILGLSFILAFSIFAQNNPDVVSDRSDLSGLEESLVEDSTSFSEPEETEDLVLGSLLSEFETDGYMCQVRYLKSKNYYISDSPFKSRYLDRDASLTFVYDSPETRNIIWRLDPNQSMIIEKFRIDKKIIKSNVKGVRNTRCWLAIEQDGKKGWLDADYALEFLDKKDVIPTLVSFTHDNETSQTFGYEVSSSVETSGNLTLYLDTECSKQTGYIESKSNGGLFRVDISGYSPNPENPSNGWFLVEHWNSNREFQKGWCMISEQLDRGGPNYMDVYYQLYAFFSCF